MNRLVLLSCLVLASAGLGQSFGFKGLNLGKGKKATADAGVSAPDGGQAEATPLLADGGVVPPPDLASGSPIMALPPYAAGKVDAEAFHELHGALKERVGKRLVAEDATLAALEKLKLGPEAAKPDGQKKLAAIVKGELVVVYDINATMVTARLLARPGAGAADAFASVPSPKARKVTRALARELVADLVRQGRATLDPGDDGLDLTASGKPPPPVEPPPPPAGGETSTEDLEVPVEGRRVAAPTPELKPAWFDVYVGGGTSFRSLQTTTSGGPVVPATPGVIASLGVDLKVFPLRLVRSLEGSRFAELWVEGQYRYSLVRGQVETNGTTTSCSVTDDEALGRVGWRYDFGGMAPHVGVTVGLANERTSFNCTPRTLDTTYTSTEYHLTLWQPILPKEKLFVEVAGGPRLLFSTRAAGFSTFAWSAEGWVATRPTAIFTLRAGARVTGTKLTTYPDGVSLTDLRTFIGLEVGAAL